MSWWWKAKPVQKQLSDSERAELLDSMREGQKEYAKETVIRVGFLVAATFMALELGGNFTEFSRDYFSVMSNTFAPDSFSGWALTAHLRPEDVTVLVTALLVFNATFAVAFVATFLERKLGDGESELFRHDWARRVRLLTSGAAALALTLTLTLLLDDLGLFTVLMIVSSFIVYASLLINSRYFSQFSVSMEVLDADRRVRAADKAKENLLDSLKPSAAKRLKRKTNSQDKQSTRKHVNRKQLAISFYCCLLVFIEATLLLAAFPLFGLRGASNFLVWVVSVTYFFMVLLIFVAIPLALITFGQSFLWVRYARRWWTAQLMQVFSIAIIFVLTFGFIIPYIGTEELPSGLMLLSFNVGCIGVAAIAVYVGKRYGRGPSKHVILLALATVNLEAFLAKDAHEDAWKRSRKQSGKNEALIVSGKLDTAKQSGNGHKSGVVINSNRNRT
jgi:hypothetical protein